MKNWKNAKNVFEELNQYVSYLVIRNHEGFFESILLDNHADIDILCENKDRKKIIRLLGAVPRLERKDNIHYKILISSEYIPIDIRVVGDGYYDRKWESDMLRNREYDSRGFFYMNSVDYFWSLLYHALYHKGSLSNEYRTRLERIKPELFPITDSDLELQLSNFMRTHDYWYTIAKDRYLWYHFTNVCKNRIHAYPLYRPKMFFLKCYEFILKILQKE